MQMILTVYLHPHQVCQRIQWVHEHQWSPWMRERSQVRVQS